MNNSMEVAVEPEINQNGDPIDVKQPELGGFSYRFYLLKLRSKKNEWVRIGAHIGSIFTQKQRQKDLPPNTNYTELARKAYSEISNKYPTLLELSDDRMKIRLTEEGFKEIDRFKSSHELPGKITRRKRGPTEENITQENRNLKKEVIELKAALNKMSGQHELDEQQKGIVSQQLKDQSQRFEREKSLIQQEMTRLISSFSIAVEDGDHVRHLLRQNIELTERTRVAELQVTEMTEKLKSYHVHPLNINEWPECILLHDFTKEYEHLDSLRTQVNTPRANMEGVDLDLIDTSVFDIRSDDLFARFLRREKFLREQKSALSHRNKQQSGAISKGDSKRDAECKSALAVFFSFVQLAVKPETLDIRYLFEKDVLEAWFIFYSGRVSPSTVGNNAKYLSLFFNFLMTEHAFQGYSAILNKLNDFFKTLCQQTKKVKETARAEQATEDAMFLLGKWMFDDEVVDLHTKILQAVSDLLEHDKEFLSGRADETILSNVKKHTLMVHLILLCCMDLGGQRREFIKGMSIENLSVLEDGRYAYHPPPEKVVRQRSSYFLLPDHVAKLLKIWQFKYHSTLAKNGVVAMWLTKEGKPMGGQHITSSVADLVEVHFPGRRITPGFFRRAIITFLVKHKMKADGPQSCSIWERRHAILMNTSPAVMHDNYIRYGMTEENQKTLEAANQQIGLVPTGELKERLDQLANANEASLETQRKKITKIIERKIEPRTGVHSYLIQYENEKEEWVPMHRLQGCRKLLTEFFEQNPRLSQPRRSVAALRGAILTTQTVNDSSRPEQSQEQTNANESSVLRMQETIIVNEHIESDVSDLQEVIAIDQHQMPSMYRRIPSFNKSNSTSIEIIPTNNISNPLPSPLSLHFSSISPPSLPPLVSTSSSPSSSPSRDDNSSNWFASPSKLFNVALGPIKRRLGDWFCNECSYDNFAFRTTCKRCNATRTTKRKAEDDINNRPKKKSEHDIIEVYAKDFNKKNEVIYQVLSRTKGKLWVSAKYVPSHLLV